jgi:Phage Mu protein F like protein
MEQRFWRTSGLNRFREASYADGSPKKLTALQLAAIDRAIYELESEPLATAIYDATELLVEAGFANARQLLDLQAGFDVVPTWALDALRGHTKQFAFLAVEREKLALARVLEQALVDGDGVREVAASIRETFAEGFHVDPDGEVLKTTGRGRVINAKAWSKMVARTELSRAENAGAMTLYRAAGVEKVRWSAANSETTCEPCSDADDEVVNLGETFPSVDVDQPPAHSNCMCGVVSADDFEGRDDESQANRDRASRGGYTADEYEAQFGHKHPIDVGDDDA